jgi:quinone-modifying oxidoreductase subunit QmoC
MATQLDPGLMDELKAFGMKDEAMHCYQCGNCVGVCSLSEGRTTFPRKLVRYAQLGMKDKIMQSPEPWLCYYCGDCTEKCPRGADPGETMMALRRYLTSLYDWTGFARRFYTSLAFEIGAVAAVAALVGLAFLIFHGPIVKDKVALNVFAPNRVIEVLDLCMAAVLSSVLLISVYRCYKTVMGEIRSKIPLKTYLGQAKELIIHTLTQKRFGRCEDRKQWWIHLLIMTGYSSVFLMVVVGIRWFQRDRIIDPGYPALSVIMSLVGYYATFAILYGTTYALTGRLKKTKTPYKNTHSTDWMFLVLLQLTTLTGILVHFAIWLNLPVPTYVVYVIHLMIAVPMLVLEVPFAKWAHLAYRPVVLYLWKVRQSYEGS